MDVNIKGEQLKFEIGSIWGVVYTFEELTAGRMAFDLSKTAALHIAMYGVLVRCNPEMVLTMDDFVEELNHITLAQAMTEYFVKRMEILSQGDKVATAIEAAVAQLHENESETDNGDKPKEPKKKENRTTQGMRYTSKPWAVMAWMRRIFSRG